MSKIEMPIKRENIYLASLYSVDNNDFVYQRHILCVLKEIRENLYKAIDIIYNSPDYLYFSNERKKNIDFIIKDVINLNNLLKYFGFSEEVDYPSCLEILKNLLNDKFAKQYYEFFGYQLKRHNTYFENGILMNRDILISDNLLDYYYLENDNNMVSTYFPIVLSLNSKSFIPSPAEGHIESRIFKGNKEFSKIIKR